MKLKPCHAVVGALSLALVGSQLWWLYQAIDQGTIEKYHEIMLHERLEALEALQTVTPAVASGLDREVLIERVRGALGVDPADIFEKDGWVVVGRVHLQFSQNGELEVVGPDLRIR